MKQEAILKNAYEVRNANYAVVHSESEVDFNQFIDALAIKDGENVIDVGGGYGPIFMRLVNRQPEINFNYDLLDGGQFQLKKAEEKISVLLKEKNNHSTVRYMHQDATALDLPDSYYDLVICKMFFHEIPQIYKKSLISKLSDIIKPGGRMVIWNPDLNESDHKFFTSVIKRKDELAGFESMVQNRHFLLNEDMYELLTDAGFTGFKKLLTFDYHLNTINRLDEEFSGDKTKLQLWNEYILQIAEDLDDETRQRLKINAIGDDIYINFKRGIFSVQKPGAI